MDPVVSVIVPAFNTVDCTSRAVVSALGQSLSRIEVIVVDDGSTDGTARSLCAIKDARLVFLRNTTNQGASNARNRAIAQARAPWIAVLDSDDWYHPRRLEMLMAFAERHNADLVADDLYIVDEHSDTPRTTLLQWAGRQSREPWRVHAAGFVRENIEGRPGARLGYTKPMFRREFLVRHDLEYDSQIAVSHDFWLDLECLVRGGAFWLLPEPYYYYTCRSTGLSSNSGAVRRIGEEIAAIDTFMARHRASFANDPPLRQALLAKRSETLRQLKYQQLAVAIREEGVGVLPGHLSLFPDAIRVFLRRLPRVLRRRYIRWTTGKPAPSRFF